MWYSSTIIHNRIPTFELDPLPNKSYSPFHFQSSGYPVTNLIFMSIISLAVSMKINKPRRDYKSLCINYPFSFQKILTEYPEVSVSLLRRFADMIRRMTARVTSMSTLSPHQRVYSELLRLCEPDTSSNGNWIIFNAPNHKDLSTWVGTDKQTVADAIGNLARDGVIERKHKDLIIRDHTRLQRLSDQ